eukprot:CAMPEP_0178400930 /NCGR_PEP_ID=MMETSP0689_2-20121128/16041_1 /TAXON_ID=160604 /ORGANISM="Amphidinium massartii, Strain CS-259" /LENGTH=136 /DNA_ID=CAMNT_0020021737 /DNA_START=82 /DNA_END=488 /DNA_ORIENTATION=+
MQRLASVVALVSCALLGAQCFLAPMGQRATADSAHQVAAGRIGQVDTDSSSFAWSPLAFGAALGMIVAVATARPVLAADLENGESIFTGNCAACHAGGNNTVVPEKKLKKDALIAYDKFGVDKIITQVTNGNGKMP